MVEAEQGHDLVAPELPELTRRAILVFSKANGFVHTEAIPAGQAMLRRIAQQQGWDIYVTDNAAVHNRTDLAKFHMVVWNNVSGDVLTLQQRTDFREWLEEGGGWLGIHASGGDPSYDWEWYVDTLVGTQFIGHPMDPHLQDADVLITGPGSELTAHLESPWPIAAEEWYAFASNPRDKGSEILLTLDESTYITRPGIDAMVGEHPIAWRHPVKNGRAVYSGIGHKESTYLRPDYQKFISRAISWAGRLDR